MPMHVASQIKYARLEQTRRHPQIVAVLVMKAIIFRCYFIVNI